MQREAGRLVLRQRPGRPRSAPHPGADAFIARLFTRLEGLPAEAQDRVQRLRDEAYSPQELAAALVLVLRDAATSDPEEPSYRAALQIAELLPLPGAAAREGWPGDSDGGIERLRIGGRPRP